jgi:hypothetical protein
MRTNIHLGDCERADAEAIRVHLAARPQRRPKRTGKSEISLADCVRFALRQTARRLRSRAKN